jgi:flagellar hook-associated protein 1 FlgK
MSFASLGIGSSALLATQRAVDVASHNIANSAVEGYTRQTVNITAGVPTPGTPGEHGTGMMGTGVVVTAIGRMRDLLTDISYRQQAAASGAANATATVLGNAQQILGPVDAGTPKALSAFYAAWDQLSTTPTDAAARQGVINAGDTVAQSLNDAATSLSQISADTGTKMAADVDTVNGLTTEIAKLNKQILAATASASAPNDLMDTRDRALDKLAGLTGATYQTDNTGQVNVFLGTTSLIRGGDSTNVALVQSGGTFSMTTTGQLVVPVTPGGELGGFMTAVNTTLPSLRADLDTVASQLITSVNAVHQAGYDLQGNQGGAFFTGTDASSIAVSSTLTTNTVAAAVRPNTPNDGDNALAVAQLRNAPVSTTGSVGDSLRSLAGRLGSLASAANQTNTAAQTALTGYQAARSSADGVSVDEEMVDLVKYQRSYEAAAKVISTANSMMDTLINGMGL